MMRVLQGVIAGLLLMLPLAAQQVSRDLVRDIIQDSQIQEVLPGAEHQAGSTSDTNSESATRRSRSTGRSMQLPALGALSPILLWAFLAVVVVILIASIARSHIASSNDAARKKRHPEPIAPAAAATEASTIALADHTRLAGEGDFAAAIHATLLEAFASCTRLLGALPTHATGRQVLGIARQRSLPTAGLGELVATAERVHFGGKPADRDLYELSARSLQQWEDACQDHQ